MAGPEIGRGGPLWGIAGRRKTCFGVRLQVAVLACLSLLLASCTCSKKETVIATDEEHDVEWVSTKTTGVGLECAGGHGFGICFPTRKHEVKTEIRTPAGSFKIRFSCGEDAKLVAEDGFERFAIKCGAEKWAILYKRKAGSAFLWRGAYQDQPVWEKVPPLHEVAHLIWRKSNRRTALVKELKKTKGHGAVADLLVRCPTCAGGQWKSAYFGLDEASKKRVRAALEKYLSSAKSPPAEVIRRGFSVLEPTTHPARIPAFTRHAVSFPDEKHITDALIGLMAYSEAEAAAELACKRIERHCGRGCELALAASTTACKGLNARLEKVQCSADLVCEQSVCATEALEDHWAKQFEELDASKQRRDQDARLLFLATIKRKLDGEVRRRVQRRLYQRDRSSESCKDALQVGEPCRCDEDALNYAACQATSNTAKTPFCRISINDQTERLTTTAVVSAKATRISYGRQLCLRMSDNTYRCTNSPRSAKHSAKPETGLELLDDGILRRGGKTTSSGIDLNIPARAKVSAIRQMADGVLYTTPDHVAHVRFSKRGGYARHRFKNIQGIALALGTACVLDEKRLQCWGPGSEHPFGTQYDVPHPMGDFDAVTGQRSAICARLPTKMARCWRGGKARDFPWTATDGFAGSGRFLCGLKGGKVLCADLNHDPPRARRVDLPERVTAVEVHDNFKCALAQSGRVYCSVNWLEPERLRWSKPPESERP